MLNVWCLNGDDHFTAEFRVQPVDVRTFWNQYEVWYMKLRNNQNWFDGQTFVGRKKPQLKPHKFLARRTTGTPLWWAYLRCFLQSAR